LEAAGRAQDAFGQYMAAFEKDPTNDEWQRSLARLDPQAALPTLEAHAREYPRDASGHGALATALSAAGRRGEAVAHFERALETGDYERWYPALRDLDPDRALEGLRRRANAEDRDAAAWALLGAELRERNLRTEAEAAYERAAAIDPSDDEVARALRDLR
jgi:tetratricopeptide (TPR) repeat protein